MHVKCVMGTLNSLKQKSHGIYLVSEKKNHYTLWGMGAEVQDLKAVDWPRDGSGLERVVDEEVVKSGVMRGGR